MEGAAVARAQVAVLTTRFALSWARRPASVAMQAAQFLIAALLIGAGFPSCAAEGGKLGGRP